MNFGLQKVNDVNNYRCKQLFSLIKKGRSRIRERVAAGCIKFGITQIKPDSETPQAEELSNYEIILLHNRKYVRFQLFCNSKPKLIPL